MKLVRRAAIDCLASVLYASAKADVVLDTALRQVNANECGLLHELVYGCLRRFYSLQADFSRFCKSKPDARVHCALLLGTYQIRHMRIPSHAAVSETVTAIAGLEPKAKGFVNAVLRRVAASEPPTKLKPHQRAELPKWMYANWRDAFGTDVVQQFCQILQQPPALCLAIFTDRSEWMAQVQSMGIAAEAGELSPYAVLLPAGTDVIALPGFDAGAFTVMDQAAQAAVLALKPAKEPALIIDLCAAPGGKSALLAHRFPAARIIAVELNAGRIPRLTENLSRLQCANVEIVQADANKLPFPDASVDAVFLDAPCSASGILRRHPDAKFLHDAEDVAKLSGLQKSMFAESLRVLKADARMIYAVCSIHPEENEQVLEGFDASAMQRLFPGHDHDGFFHATVTLIPTI